MEKIKELIRKKEKRCFPFHPDISFYDATGINNKRWAKIYRGEIEPTLPEVKAIAEFFEVEITELI